ncbi:hypothetical protein SODALDRAFT_279291 [Sodiomyces alkalinus F11]|uniref:CBM21 domain-containing protein n=1 Tax=Sodiomyces alkalinus (strain CBS 110278 / VKM F-3762 / F11) TaxID=1314773 RepID=A0A3N2PUT0_SODAK|nr:hypothetical protein SODALDRAFT_279291 [Sodiomyces alkalinus F11]ROT38252.1 hypothetical protein SODALDRAFT_279291 [Sodiomyces alkalinus F11]
MPYTPPSNSRSPAHSTQSSPDVSRRPSVQSGSRPPLPRSTSYLTKSRRTPPVAVGGDGFPTPPGTCDDLQDLAVTDDRGIHNGAVTSPPDSMSGSDEEDNRPRGLHFGTTLKELRDAVISLRRDSDPDITTLHVPDRQGPTSNGIIHSFSTSALDQLHASERRRSHSRFSSDSDAGFSHSAKTSTTGSEEESEEDRGSKPPMVRKKSGELVRPALRPPSRKRPSSMPGTPTCKAVHFDSHLEHVRHFLQVDRPLAVSAGSSPVDDYDSETEYPFTTLDRPDSPTTTTTTYQWEIVITNPPVDSVIRKAQPVRLEKVWLWPDQKSLVGSIAVANFAFQKSVTCRFTLDYWKTTSEVNADFAQAISEKGAPHSHDRFTFAIKLSDTAHLETKTLYFCIRYNVIGQEFWDNNDHANFQVDFRKKPVPRSGKRGLPGATNRAVNGGGLPRSNRWGNPSPLPSRPKPRPTLDDINGSDRYSFGQSMDECRGGRRPRLKHKSSESDNLSGRVPAPSGQAFSNRYDFGASLSAAVQAAKDALGKDKDRNSGGLYMKSSRPASSAPQQSPAPNPPAPNVAPTLPGTGSSTTSLSASSYQEMVNKYCFVRTSRDHQPETPGLSSDYPRASLLSRSPC